MKSITKLHISSEDPSNQLKQISEFIMKVYVPNWFQIKLNESVLQGPIHLHDSTMRAQYLLAPLRETYEKIILKNWVFAHPENILFAMVNDSNLNNEYHRSWQFTNSAIDFNATSHHSNARSKILPQSPLQQNLWKIRLSLNHWKPKTSHQ